MVERELPLIDGRLCTGCGDCIRVCPTDCLRIFHQVPVLTFEKACIHCGLCAVICPVAAVSMVPPA